MKTYRHLYMWEYFVFKSHKPNYETYLKKENELYSLYIFLLLYRIYYILLFSLYYRLLQIIYYILL